MASKRMNEVLQELKEYSQMKKEVEEQIAKLQTECKQYMTDNELSELFNDDKSIVARYTEVISNRFDTTAFKKSEWSELYSAYLRRVTSMRFTVEYTYGLVAGMLLLPVKKKEGLTMDCKLITKAEEGKLYKVVEFGSGQRVELLANKDGSIKWFDDSALVKSK